MRLYPASCAAEDQMSILCSLPSSSAPPPPCNTKNKITTLELNGNDGGDE